MTFEVESTRYIEWRTGPNCTVGGVVRNKGAYGFTYDAANRLTGAKYGAYNSSNTWQAANVDRYSVQNVSYDDNSNIKTLRRRGLTGTCTWGVIDDLTYTYHTAIPNQLTSLAEISLLDRGFKKISAGATGYTYDASGNVNADGYRGITLVETVGGQTDDLACTEEECYVLYIYKYMIISGRYELNY